MDESIAIVRGLAAGGYFEYHGQAFDLPSVKIAPVPPDPIPVLIGGHSDAALRRAAWLGDGWLHGGGGPADLPGLLARLARFRREEGTDTRPFEVHAISADAYTADGVRRLADLGVTDLIVGFRWPYVTGPDTEPLERKLGHLRHFARHHHRQTVSLTHLARGPAIGGWAQVASRASPSLVGTARTKPGKTGPSRVPVVSVDQKPRHRGILTYKDSKPTC
jgi:alkanesulfonate monooxygenase SsuD/methylene tetrahydromethanopterin reductase-like flavin-dependent oxidoreductase (luciferase family)